MMAWLAVFCAQKLLKTVADENWLVAIDVEIGIHDFHQGNNYFERET